MIKKTILIIFLYCVLTSCGKKGDPEYKDLKKQAKIEIILTNII
jgi:predicted small lipoprotein YifL|tara:strand:- start:327 stop:458 length:132 start_codon:yes stop_codon:yes gene_type:complete